MCIVVVYSLKLYGYSVYKKLSLFADALCSEADLYGYVLSCLLDHYCIEIGLLGAPEDRSVSIGFFHFGIKELIAVITVKLFVISAYADIKEVSLRSCKKIYVTEDTVVTEEILILKIASYTPFIHLGDYLVISCLKRHLELRCAMRNSRKAYVLTVDEKLNTRGNTLKHQICFHFRLFCIHADDLAVYTHGIIVGNEWGIHRVRIIYVCVVGLLVSRHLPAGRHVHLIPLGYHVGTVDISRIISEIPLSVKENVKIRRGFITSQRLFKGVIRDIVRSWGQSVLVDTAQIFIFSHIGPPKVYNRNHYITAVSFFQRFSENFAKQKTRFLHFVTHIFTKTCFIFHFLQ